MAPASMVGSIVEVMTKALRSADPVASAALRIGVVVEY
jgi:hypothetical protein